MKTTRVLQTNISETSLDEVSKALNSFVGIRVAICNANTLVRSVKNTKINNIINDFTIKTPDGFPVAKALSFFSKQKFLRVDGYNLFLQTIKEGINLEKRHYFFGNDIATTQAMIDRLSYMFPEINIAGFLCPEIMTPDQLFKKYRNEIESIDADIVWVSLGFPKQEIFIDHVFKEGRPNLNYVGIGGVFEWVAGTKRKAPEWIANLGLEWFLRLVQDPKRLYKRYFIDNTLFIVYFLRQALFRR